MARVMVVEDESIVAKDLEYTLGRLGHEVVATAASGREAIAAATACAPDLLLMDVRIQGELDGIEAARAVRRTLDVPVIYLTAFSDEETVRRAGETEAHGFLVKPFHDGDLRGAIEIALHKHRADRALRARERWFSTTLRSIGDAVVATDAAGAVTFMNPVAERLTGWSERQARGAPVDDVFRVVAEATGGPVPCPAREALREGRITGPDVPTLLVRGDGIELPVDDSAAPIADAQGRTEGAVLVFRDVTERRRLERSVETTQRLAAIGTLTAGVAHELNNPLSSTVANCGFALEELAALDGALAGGATAAELRGRVQEAMAALRDARHGALRVAEIVAQLRALAREEAPVTPVDLAAVAAGAARLTRSAVAARARFSCEAGPGVFVAGHAARLEQVLVNLLVNAAQAIPEGAPEAHEVSLRVGRDGGRAVVEVRDTGCGIAPEVLPRIFDPFFSTRPVGSGVGLGLALCHGIAAAHRGEIQVSSERGKGTTFRLVLPATALRPADGAPAPAGGAVAPWRDATPGRDRSW